MQLIEQRVELLETQSFDAEAEVGSGFPGQDSIPRNLDISVTASLEGAFVILSWGNWLPTVKGYEIWAERPPDGQLELLKTVQYSPATLTVAVESATPMVFKIRPVMETGEEIALDRAPSIAATIPIAQVESGDIANGAIQNQHFDRVTANKIVIVDADIVSLTATKLTAGTINAAIISVVNLNASNINSGTLTSINISAGTYSLTSGVNQMTIDGTNGFRQYNSSTFQEVRIINGAAAGYRNSNLVWALNSLNLGGGSSYQGSLDLYHNGSIRVQLRARTGNTGSELIMYDQSATSDIALIADNTAAGTVVGLYVQGQRVVGPRVSAITPPSGGAIVDTQARTAISDILNALSFHGLTG